MCVPHCLRASIFTFLSPEFLHLKNCFWQGCIICTYTHVAMPLTCYTPLFGCVLILKMAVFQLRALLNTVFWVMFYLKKQPFLKCFFEPARCAWSLYCYSPSLEMILPEIKDIQDLLIHLSICETTDAMCAPHCLTASCFTFYFLVKSNMCTPLSESKTFYFLSTCETIILNVCE